MSLYLRSDLLKSTAPPRGGKYVAREQVGYNNDGSAVYRYFQTLEEYRRYLEMTNSGKKTRSSTAHKPQKPQSKRAFAAKTAGVPLYLTQETNSVNKSQAKPEQLFIWSLD